MTQALCQACQNGHDKCVSLLLQYGADPLIVVANDPAATILQLISSRGHDKCLSLLLQNPNVLLLLDKPCDTGETPLYFACLTGHVKCVVVLVEHGANVNIICGLKKTTPLIASAQSGKVNVVAYLLTKGVNINYCSDDGMTAVQQAHVYGHRKCVELLIEHGADESSLQGLEFATKKVLILFYE